MPSVKGSSSSQNQLERKRRNEQEIPHSDSESSGDDRAAKLAARMRHDVRTHVTLDAPKNMYN